MFRVRDNRVLEHKQRIHAYARDLLHTCLALIPRPPPYVRQPRAHGIVEKVVVAVAVVLVVSLGADMFHFEMSYGRRVIII